MKAQVSFRTLLQVNGAATEAALTEFAISHLKERGFFVFNPETKGTRERPGDLIKRLGISHSHLNRRLADENCPQVEIEYSNRYPETPRHKKTRVRFIISNPAFDRFLTAHQQ